MTHLIAHGSKAVQAVRIIAAVADAKKCQKCGAVSGDDWSQCKGSCPIPGSPHYNQPPAQAGGDKLARVSAVREARQCGIDQARRVVNREDLIADIEAASSIGDIKRILLRAFPPL